MYTIVLNLKWLYSLVPFSSLVPLLFLNQARAWFLRIASVRELQYVCLYACVCVPALEAINN